MLLPASCLLFSLYLAASPLVTLYISLHLHNWPCISQVEIPWLNKNEILNTLAKREVFDDRGLAELERLIGFDIGMKQLQLITEMAVTNSTSCKRTYPYFTFK